MYNDNNKRRQAEILKECIELQKELDYAKHCKMVQNLGGAIAGDYVCSDSLTRRYRAI